MRKKADVEPNYYPDLVAGSGQAGTAAYIPPVLRDFHWAMAHPSTDATVNEARLFHGTTPDTAKIICEQGSALSAQAKASTRGGRP
jgi:hypothetical protein